MSEQGSALDRRRQRSTAVLDLIRSIATDENPTDALARGIRTLGLGDAHRIGNASVRLHDPSSSDALRLAIIGTHDRHHLAPTTGATVTSAIPDDVSGPGVASQVGPFLAFVLGARLATAARPASLDITALSAGPDDSLAAVTAAEHLGTPDLIVFTESVAWQPELPTLTTGNRGRVEARITISAAQQANDRAYAGASLNPLNRLIEIVAALRNDRGRITLPGFYSRAVPPSRGSLSAVVTDGWSDGLGMAQPSGSLSFVERATQWPVLSVLGIDVDGDRRATPSAASAHIAISLVPDQRPVDVELALRTWLTEQLPESLNGSVRVLSSARPWVVESDDAYLNLLSGALASVHGKAPTPVPAGGTLGAGEVHFQTGAPVLHVGIAGPDQGWGTTHELLPARLFEAGVAVAEHFTTKFVAHPPR